MSGNEAMDFTIWQVAFAYIFLLIVLFIVRVKKIPRGKLIFVSALRMTLQLIIVGYVLVYVLDNPHPLITVAIVFVMLSFAVFNVYQRTKAFIRFALKKMIALAMF